MYIRCRGQVIEMIRMRDKNDKYTLHMNYIYRLSLYPKYNRVDAITNIINKYIFDIDACRIHNGDK